MKEKSSYQLFQEAQEKAAKEAWDRIRKWDAMPLEEVKKIRPHTHQLNGYIRDREKRESTGEVTGNTCTWTYDDEEYVWWTACGEGFQTMEGSPLENKMGFCPYCGRKLREVIP